MPDKTDDALPVSRQAILWLALIFAAAFLVRLIFLEAPCFAEDTDYLNVAAADSPRSPDLAGTPVCFRWGMLAPLWLLQCALSYSLFTYYFFSVSFYMLMLSAVFLVARAVGGWSTAVISICIAGTSTLLLTSGSNVFPDFPNLAFLLISFVLFRRTIRAPYPARSGLAAAAASGFVAYLFYAPATIWLCCLPLYEWCERRSLRRSRSYAVIFLGLLALECASYAILLGEPFARFAAIANGIRMGAADLPALSVTQYLFDPLRMVLSGTTGALVLGGAVAGLLLAWRRRNWTLVSLAAGAAAAFCVYGYAVAGFEPLRLAFPLQSRHFVAFTAVAAVAAGYFLAEVYSGRVFLRRPTAWRWGSVAAGMLIVGAQMMQLPHTVGQRGLLFGKDRFYVADRVYRDLQFGIAVRGPVHAAPIEAFRLYPALQQIPAQELSLDRQLPAGATVLFSQRFLESELARAEQSNSRERPGRSERTANLKRYLTRHPAWEYLMDTGDVVLARIDPPADAPSSLPDPEPDDAPATLDVIAPPLGAKIWSTPPVGKPADPSVVNGDERRLTFHLPSAKPLSLYTFPGRWPKPPQGWGKVLEPVCRGNRLGFRVTYELTEDVTSLVLTLSEYDDRKPLSLKTRFLPTDKGLHQVEDFMTLSAGAWSFRVGLRATCENDSVLTFHQFEMGAAPHRNTLPAFATVSTHSESSLAVSEHGHATQ